MDAITFDRIALLWQRDATIVKKWLKDPHYRYANIPSLPKDESIDEFVVDQELSFTSSPGVTNGQT
jgi:hypothetical protein